MGKQVYYRQCRMRKNYEAGNYSEQVSYIPESFCIKGKVLKLRGSDNKWDDGWVVVGVSSNKVLDESIPDVHKGIRGHRKATGDCLM
jgi:hypothetical protein